MKTTSKIAPPLKISPPPPLKKLPEIFFCWWLLTMTATPQLMLNRKWYQASKPEMLFHIINIMYAAMPMRAKIEKTTFSCKDDCTLTKRTWRWTYSALQYLFYLYSVSLGDALTTDAIFYFDDHIFRSLRFKLISATSYWYRKFYRYLKPLP